MKMRGIMLLLSVIAGLAAFPARAGSQAMADVADSSSSAVNTTPMAAQPELKYMRPTEKMRLRNYFFDTFGPYPIVGAAFVGGINQSENTPPEWGQGAAAYGKRFGSDFGIAAVSTTTRYGLARVFREDALYYRCECKGTFPRLRHAVMSTFVARRGHDGHRVFSVAGLVAPYAGTMTAVYGWFPDRYNAKDAFRMGNYNLLVFMGGNIALEFVYGGPHSFLHRLHLNNGHAAPDPGSTP